MKSEKKLFDDLLKYTKRLDRRCQNPHPIVPILMGLGIQKQTVARHLTDGRYCCRSTAYNLLDSAMPKVSKQLEQQLLVILKQSLVQAVKISKNYKKFYKLNTIEQFNMAIISGKHYLESLDESINDVDFEGLCESQDIGIQDDDFIKNYINYVGE